MREIKFRAWDKKKKDMYYKDDSDKDGKDEWYASDWGVFNQSLDTVFEKFELMQYTGLKDKNGKEIYEGDIITGEDYHSVWIAQVWFGLSEVYSSEWHGSNYGWHLKLLRIKFNDEYQNKPFYKDKIPEFETNFDDDLVCEVMGNIYDNPELLNSK